MVRAEVDRDGFSRKGELGSEEAQTRVFLGRMRAAVATKEEYELKDEGKRVWQQKDALAHSLYARRLQVQLNVIGVLCCCGCGAVTTAAVAVTALLLLPQFV